MNMPITMAEDPIARAPAPASEELDVLQLAHVALSELVARCREAKKLLDENIPDGEPVHPVSAMLTWPMSTALLAIDKLQQHAPSGEDAEAAYRRGVQDGGRIVFDAVMPDERNRNRGLDLYHRLREVAADALAEKVIVADPDEQPLWEHLIQEAYDDFFARHRGRAPYVAAVGMEVAFSMAVRGMLAKKLPAPDSENMRLREALCRIHQARTGEQLLPTEPLNRLLAVAGTPAAAWREIGEPDPHGNRYDIERATLAMGHLTDDELANEVFLRGDKRPTSHELVAGVLPPIAYLTAAKDRIRWLSRQVVTLQEAVERKRRLANDMGAIVHDMTVANQSAWIEWRHGKGAEAAMVWIHNGLAGPGHIPDEDAPYGKEAQAWYDANNANPLPECKCGRPSNIAWKGQGFCSEAHYQEARALAEGGAA